MSHYCWQSSHLELLDNMTGEIRQCCVLTAIDTTLLMATALNSKEKDSK